MTTATKGATHTALSDGDYRGHAKKIISAARRKSTRIAADRAINRSTRERHALKVKADALDEIAALK